MKEYNLERRADRRRWKLVEGCWWRYKRLFTDLPVVILYNLHLVNRTPRLAVADGNSSSPPA